MSLHPFNEVNAHLIKRLGGRTECVGRDYSYFKIVQHGMIYAFNGTTKKLLKTYFHWPIFLQLLRYAVVGKQFFFRPKRTFKKTLILDPGRDYFGQSKTPRSAFFDWTKTQFPKDTFSTICYKDEPKPYSDFSLSDFPKQSFSFSNKEIERIRDVNEVIKKLNNSGHYTEVEMKYISSCFHVFLEQYLRYFGIFKNQPIEKIYFIAHYHNEGIIAAAKDLGIAIYELQHGLISSKDLYYVYDSVFQPALHNALFPDIIYLYGDYWKTILQKGVEWQPSQLKILGSSMLGQEVFDQIVSFEEKEKCILVASQKGMADLYIPLINQLIKHLENHPSWRVIVKLHPGEKEIDRYHGLQHDRLEIAPLVSGIHTYVQIARAQLSIYSTTLFDASGYEIINMIWLKPGLGMDYAEELIEHRMGIVLSENQDPFAILEQELDPKKHFIDRKRLYSNFDSSQLI